MVTNLNIVQRVRQENLKVNNLVVIDKHFVLVFSCEFEWENNQNFSFLTEVILRN